jgi:hypothetical protein
MKSINSFEEFDEGAYSDDDLDLEPVKFEKAVTRSDTAKKALQQEKIITTRSETFNTLFNKVSEQNQKIKNLEKNLVSIIDERDRLEEQVRVAQLALNNKNLEIMDLEKNNKLIQKNVEKLTERVLFVRNRALYRKKQVYFLLLGFLISILQNIYKDTLKQIYYTFIVIFELLIFSDMYEMMLIKNTLICAYIIYIICYKLEIIKYFSKKLKLRT